MSAVNHLKKIWSTLESIPFGKRIASGLFGKLVPYSGTIQPEILELRPGFAKIQMKDRRAVRNHLNSIHAIALANLGEMTSGLAFTIGLPENTRAIPTTLKIEFLKKARGKLTAEAKCPILDSNATSDHLVEALIRNASGELVARVYTDWRVGPA